VVVPADDIEVTVKGSKNIDDITVSGDNSKVILDNASADNVTLDGEKSAVETKNGAKIDNVIVTENAPGATVDVGSGTTIGNVENHAEDATVTGNGTVKDAKDELFLAIRENMSIRRFARIADGFSVPYVHMKGKIGVIVNLTVEGCDATEIGKDIAMQIAALNPRFWDKSQVTQDVLDEEKEVMLGQMANDPKMANKPDQVKEKIVMGKLNKFYAENCLLQQAFVKDGDVSVEQYMNNAAKALGGKVSFNTAVRFEKGEGIEKKQENFAAEIASMVNGNK